MAYLNKKSWHVGSYRALEKVYEAKKAAAEEKQRIEVLQRERDEERKNEALRRLQRDAGLRVGGVVERLDWMYATLKTTPPPPQQQQSPPSIPADTKVKSELAMAPGTAVHALGAPCISVPLSASDCLSRLRDDPLLAIMQSERKHIECAEAKRNDILQQIKAKLQQEHAQSQPSASHLDRPRKRRRSDTSSDTSSNESDDRRRRHRSRDSKSSRSYSERRRRDSERSHRHDRPKTRKDISTTRRRHDERD